MLNWPKSFVLCGSSTDPSNPGDVNIQTSGWDVTTVTSALKFYLRYFTVVDTKHTQTPKKKKHPRTQNKIICLLLVVL